MIFQATKHIVTFVTAAFNAFVPAVSRTVLPQISGDQLGICDVDYHGIPPNKV
jgi:hypothetical protein